MALQFLNMPRQLRDEQSPEDIERDKRIAHFLEQGIRQADELAKKYPDTVKQERRRRA
jgi:hypothetical protein